MTWFSPVAAIAPPREVWLFLVMVLTRGTVLFLLTWLITAVFPRARPELRHLLWFAAICGFIVLPVGRWMLPLISFSSHGEGTALGVLLAPLAYRESMEAAIAGIGPQAQEWAAAGVWRAFGAAAYLGGVLCFGLRPVLARRALLRLAADALPNARASDIVEHLARRWGLRRKVAVLVHEQVSIPFTYGFLNPRIMLPAASRSWSRRQMSPVLAHEVAHVKRGDSLVGAVAHAVCSILWFVPPLWVSRLLMRQEAERSCDVFVLSQGVPKREYASMLVEFAAQRRGASFLAAHALLGRRSSIERRIRNILDWTHASWTGGDRFRAAAVVVPCLLVVLTAIGLSVVQRNGLFGTWAGIGQHGSARYTWSDDGIGKRYATGYVSSGVGSGQVPESLMVDLGPFVIQGNWTDSNGDTWYKVKTWWRSRAAPRYALIRLDASGNAYESDESANDYPAGLMGAIGAGLHQRYIRQ